MPCGTEYPCRCHLFVSDFFCGQHCHKITDVYLSCGVKVVSPGPWCRYCVPFTCGHSTCLPRQLKYPGLTSVRWLIATSATYVPIYMAQGDTPPPLGTNGPGLGGDQGPPPYFGVEELKKRRIRVIRDSGRARFQDLGPDLGLVLGLVLGLFLPVFVFCSSCPVVQNTPAVATFVCRIFLCGQHCHKITDVYLACGVKVVSPCPWRRYCVPFTCGHSTCLPRQLEYPGLTSVRWLIATSATYDSDTDSESE